MVPCELVVEYDSAALGAVAGNYVLRRYLPKHLDGFVVGVQQPRRKDLLDSRYERDAEQRDASVRIPADLSERDLGCLYTLSDRDLRVVEHHRQPANRLGFAV
jgi:hypothetical protein